MSLLTDLKRIMVTNVENIERKTGITIHINKHDPEKLLKGYLTLMLKLIVPMEPRTVLISEELQDKIDHRLIPDKYIPIIYEIKEKFENGEDLNPFLSKDAFQPEKQDGLLFDWGIKHLHLSTEVSPQGYLKKRTEYQLIFYQKDNNVYFIDVLIHPKGDEWAKDDFINILERNWSHLLDKYRVDYFSSAEHMTQKDRYDSRRGGLITFVDANGSVYMPPGGGIVSDRSSAKATSQKIQILRLLKMKDLMKKEMEKEISKKNLIIPSTLELKLLISDSMISIIEKNTDTIVKSNITWFEYS